MQRAAWCGAARHLGAWFHMLLLLGLGWLGRRPVAGGTATHSTYYYKRVAYIEEI
jgi:hypothetical protein